MEIEENVKKHIDNTVEKLQEIKIETAKQQIAYMKKHDAIPPIGRPARKTDCYFYHEEPGMGAHIPSCNYFSKLGYCPCEECNKYISKSNIDGIVREFVDK